MVPVNLYEKYVSRKGFVIKIETPKVDETVRIAKIPEARVVDLSTTEEPAPLPEVVTKNAKNLPREYSESSPREAFSGPATHVYRSPNQR